MTSPAHCRFECALVRHGQIAQHHIQIPGMPPEDAIDRTRAYRRIVALHLTGLATLKDDFMLSGLSDMHPGDGLLIGRP